MKATPIAWRKDWTLHRSVTAQDSRGNPIRQYDMETPDFVGAAGTASGVAWHVASLESTLREYGEGVSGAASFLLDSDLTISPFDRCVFGGSVWEVRSVLPRSGFRTVKLVEVKRL